MSTFEERERLLIDKLTATDPLGQVAQVAKHLPQAEATKILRYATASGDAPDVVAQNLRAYETDTLGSTDWENLLKEAPKTKVFLSNPLPLAVVGNKDNAQVLAGLEGEQSNWGKISASMLNAVKSAGTGLIGSMTSIAEKKASNSDPDTELAPEYQNWRKESLEKTAGSLIATADSDLMKRKEVKADTDAGRYGLAVVEGLTQLAMQAIVAGATGGTGSLAFMGAQIQGNQYLDLRKDGVDADRALTASVANAIVQAPLERTGLNRIMRAIPAKTSAQQKATEIIKSGLTEALTEWLQQYPDAASEIYARNPQASPVEIAQEFLRTFGDTTKEGLYQGLVALPIGMLGGSVKVAMQRQATQAFVDSVDKQIAILSQSEWAKQNPELIAQHADAITRGASVYIDPDALVLYQIDNPKVLEELGLTEREVNAALKTGEMVEVPTGQYKAAAMQDAGLHAALRDDIAPTTDGLTQRRVTERKNDKDVKRATDKTLAEESGMKDWSRDYTGQLKESGIEGDVARQVIVGLQAHARAMSDNPVEWLRQNAPEFRTGEAMQPGALAQPLNPDVNPHEQVPVVDLSRAIPKGEYVSQGDLLAHIKSLINQNTAIPSGDGKAVIKFPDKGDKYRARHIVYSSKKREQPGNVLVRKAGIKSIDALISNSVLIETTVNEKTDKKPDVEYYHRFFVPVRHGNTVKTIMLTAEQYKGKENIVPVDATLYDVMVADKKGAVPPNTPTAAQGSTRGKGAAQRLLSTISIKEMLTGVNDYNRNPYFQERQSNANGSIHWENGKAIITMMQTGNPSTVVHEMVGHFFFQNLVERAKMDEAPEQVKKDVSTLFEWANYAGKSFDDLTREERTDLHEKVARAAEAYVMTGKAPSVATQGLFRRFAEWMKQVYKSVRELGVEVTPEVSAVFDRMLATNAEIAELEAVEQYHRALPEAFLSQLTDRQRARLDNQLLNVRAEAEERLRAQLMQDISAENKAQYAEEEAAATERFTAEVEAEQLYKTAAIVSDTFKQPAKSVAQTFKSGKMRQDREAEFEYVAELAGYTSGDELATRLIEANNANDEIAARVKTFMQTNFSDLLNNKQALQDEARNAMYTDGGAALLAMEQMLIEEKAGRFMDAEQAREAAVKAREAARATARAQLAKRTITEATALQSYIAAERRAAADAAKFLQKGDYENAAAAKERQLLNHAFVQESLAVRREAERIKRYLNKQKKTKNWMSDATDENGLRVKTSEFRDQAAAILARFGFARKDATTPEETLAEWVRRQEADEVNGEIINIAPWIAFDTNRRTIGKLTLEELQDVENAIRNIKKLAQIGANSDGFAFINGEGLEATVEGLLDRSARLTDKQVDKIEKEKTSWLKDMLAGMKQGHRMFEALDAFKSFGPWYQTFYESLQRATDFRSALLSRVTEHLEAAFTEAGIDKAERYRMAHKKIFIPEWNQSVTKNTLLAIALNMGNQGNIDRLTATRLVGVGMAAPWDLDSIKAVLQVHLTAADIRLVGKVWQAIDVYDEYNAMVKRMTGNELPKVEPLPIEFNVGGETIRLAGGYYPLSQDTRGSKQAELNAEKKLGETPGLMPYPSAGRSKSRTNGAKYAVDTDLASLYGNMSDIVQDIAFRPVAHDINKLMRDERVVGTIRAKLGDAEYKAVLEWQKRITSGRAENVKHPLDRFFTWARGATVISSLLLRPGVAVQNVANVLLYGNSVEGWTNQDALSTYMRHGWADYIPNALANSARAKELREYVYSKSVMMRDKKQAPDFSFREINEAGAQENVLMRAGSEAVQEIGYKTAAAQESVNKFASDVFAFTDQLTDIPMWLGAYEKAKENGRTEAQAVHFADAIIRNSTGTGRNLDTSWMQASGSPAMRLFTMFQTFLNTAYNRWSAEAGVYLQEGDKARLIKFVAGQYLAFGVLSALFSFKTPDEDKEPWKWFVKEVLAWPLGMIPLFGGIAKTAIDSSLGFYTYGYTATPVESKAKDVLKLASTAQKVAQGQKEIGDLAEPAAGVASFFMRYPDQINDWFFNAYDVLAGNMEPEARDLVRRRPARERR